MYLKKSEFLKLQIILRENKSQSNYFFVNKWSGDFKSIFSLWGIHKPNLFFPNVFAVCKLFTE